MGEAKRSHDRRPIVDHFRGIDGDRVLGLMKMRGDAESDARMDEAGTEAPYWSLGAAVLVP